jgi:hypothetical protein
MSPVAKARHCTVLVLALAVASLALTSAGWGAGSSLSLKVKGEYAKLHRTQCGKTKNFRAFHRRSMLEFRGFLTPGPAGHFPVRVKIERCVGHSWRRVVDYSISGKKLTGKFKGFFPAAPLAPPARRHHRATAYYRAKAFAGGAASREAYFIVGS